MARPRPPVACLTYSCLRTGGLLHANLRDFFFLYQAEVAADVEAEVPREEAGHPLAVKRTVGLVRACVRRTLHDPDLTGAAVRVIEAAAVTHRHDVVGAPVDEEKGTRLQRAHHRDGARLRKA